MTPFWAVSHWELTSALAPREVDERLQAALSASALRRPRLVGKVAEGRLVAWVRPFSIRADLHPRLSVTVEPTAEGSRLVCRIAPRRWALAFHALLIAGMAALALFSLAVSLNPQLDLRAHKPWQGFVVFSGATLVGLCQLALLLGFARHDRAILSGFVRSALEAQG